LNKPTLQALTAEIEGTPLAEELEVVRACARSVRCDVYLVGGLVRDLLAGRRSTDIDLVTTGDVEVLSGCLAERLGVVFTTYPVFRTAKIFTPAGFRLDLVGSRAEEYLFPGSLPSTRPGSLFEDLARRDFTVNTMAVSLVEPGAELIDPHRGRLDLEAGLLRVLHSASFRDDPTRVLRGVRFSSELGLMFEKRTRELACEQETLAALGKVSGFRIWRELEMALRGGETARAAVSLLRDLGLEKGLHSALAADDDVLDRLAAADAASPAMCLAIWAEELDRGAKSELGDRLALSRSDRKVLLAGADTGAGR